MTNEIFVYCAGPLTQGHLLRNVSKACEHADDVRRLGGVPVIPHLFVHDDAHFPRTYQFWIDEDLKRLDRCDLLYLIPGYSPGAEIEVAHAQERGIHVCRSYEELDLAMGRISKAMGKTF